MGAATFLAKLNKDAPGDLLSPYPLNLDGWMDGWMIFCWIFDWWRQSNGHLL